MKKTISCGAFFSAFSFGEGVLSPEKLAEGLEKNGHLVLPITDCGGFWGLVDAIKAAKKHGLRIVPGIFFPLSEGGIFLYPGNETAYRSICRVASSFQYFLKNSPKVFFPIELLEALEGVGRAVAIGEMALKGIPKVPSSWKSFWGIPEHLSLSAAKKLAPIARQFQLTPLAFPILRYVRPGDEVALKILKGVHENQLASKVNLPSGGKLFPPEVLAASFSWFPETIEGNRRFFDFTFWHPPLGTWHMPEICRNSELSRRRLWFLAEDGARRRYGKITPLILNRLKSEFNIIIEKNFTDYFLVVQEIVEESERRGHRVLGRGSAANSLISYCLRFTHVDPIKYGLFFERFLNPERSSPPDIDLDFSWKVRDEIYDFLRTRWGEEKVALISTQVKLGGRGAIRETGKVLGFTSEEITRFTRAIGHLSAREFLIEAKNRPECKFLPHNSAEYRKLLYAAARIEGLPTHFSLHAGGIVIAPQGIDRFCPIQPSSKPIPMTQMDMYALEEVGLVKIDLLSQRSLGVFSDLFSHLKSTKNIPPILDNVEELASAPPVLEALEKGDTMGVFYIESPGMRSLLKKLRCRSFSELTAASSVIRPGVAESGMMQAYISRHRDPSTIPQIHPLLESILGETYGVMIYQEDVIKTAGAIAGFSLGEADLLRRAMSGKSRGESEMAQTRDRFLLGAFNRGVDQESANEIWRQIQSFSGYAFCKAHSASYAVLSLQLLWLKKLYPAHFFAAVLNNRGGFYHRQAYVNEARRHGIEFDPPDVHTSEIDCTVNSSRIQIGFSFIQGVSENLSKRISSERKISSFKDLIDFVSRVSPKENELEGLLNSGALRKFGPPAACRWTIKLSNPGTLFPEPTSEPPPTAKKTLSTLDWARLELNSLGMIISLNPLDLYNFPQATIRSNEMLKFSGKNVRMGGLLIAAKTVITKKQRRMKFLSLEDYGGTFEVTMFPPVWKKFGHIVGDGGVFLAEGRIDCDWDVPTLIASEIRRIPELKK
ncbi:MAG: DNA polymerase III subunit alpha [Candidatus Riflebacteria bacterium]|nr:DNA polymerase III subunit alpha [Candidatus Riflebacteria bacterium]